MARPLRHEFKNAVYHVSNRARIRHRVFHSDEYYQQFLETLDEAHQRFGVEILAYCLLNNEYHLLVKTPEANLSRAMRHINGVYTQRHNRIKGKDGVVFRGRYKSILVENGKHELQVSRYIHRLPLEGRKKSDTSDLAEYEWSSYPAYLNKAKAPRWLNRDDVLFQLDPKKRAYKQYGGFVDEGVDEDTARFYDKKNTPSVMGSDKFRDKVFVARTKSRGVSREEITRFRLSIAKVIKAVADEFGVKPADIKAGGRQASGKNMPRWVAMYLCQEAGGHTLSSIARYLGFKHYATVSTTIGKLKLEMETDPKLSRQVNALMKKLA